MKRILSFTVAILLALTMVFNANAQTNETIWLTADTMAYKTGETVYVVINASSATPIQGFTFQIRYDPSCLSPVNASSPIPGMNGLPLPQLNGLVDGSYASTNPQSVNGILAEVRFTALKGCQTGLTLESAALAVRNPEGFAIPLAGVLLGNQSLSLIIDSATGVANVSQPEESGSILHLAPPQLDQGIPTWIAGIMFVILVGLLMLGAYRVLRLGTARGTRPSKPSRGSRKPVLHIRHGPQAGRSLALKKLPVLIGRDPQNDICINDPHIISQHAQIYARQKGVFLRDLGGETFINGHQLRSSAVVLRSGDVVRLGRSFMFVFG